VDCGLWSGAREGESRARTVGEDEEKERETEAVRLGRDVTGTGKGIVLVRDGDDFCSFPLSGVFPLLCVALVASRLIGNRNGLRRRFHGYMITHVQNTFKVLDTTLLNYFLSDFSVSLAN
jgi:hypothetical protein